MARLLLLAWLLAPLMAVGADRSLTVGYVDFPPYQFRNASGEPDGRFVELTRKVAREAGYDLNFLYLPTARVYYYLESGAIDLWQGFADNPELGDRVLESDANPLRVPTASGTCLTLPSPITSTICMARRSSLLPVTTMLALPPT